MIIVKPQQDVTSLEGEDNVKEKVSTPPSHVLLIHIHHLIQDST